MVHVGYLVMQHKLQFKYLNFSMVTYYSTLVSSSMRIGEWFDSTVCTNNLSTICHDYTLKTSSRI